MAEARLTFEHRKCILEWFMRFDNVVEVQRQWRREYETELPTSLTIKRIIDKFEAHGTICDIHKGRSGRPRTATSPASSAVVLRLIELKVIMSVMSPESSTESYPGFSRIGFRENTGKISTRPLAQQDLNVNRRRQHATVSPYSQKEKKNNVL
ncbi:hypothetical protein ANN_17537 [Periplaneta americana]|uniref:DUF4817 domain-containing protein n=1 Tax=Periplaneta americana TaxID=6978 RepID=A0ABQ8STS8_PERAM|nr:hypothetical protein ANN_17537 [Periplaneta americana]